MIYSSILKVKKIILISTIASSFLVAESTIADYFKNGEVNGNVRAGYIMDKASVDDAESSAFAVGGKFHYNTDPSQDYGMGATFYTTQGLGFNDSEDKNSVFFSSENESYTILSEAYISANVAQTAIKIGRQHIDTPLAGIDDGRMIPNSFEAVTAVNTSLKDIVLVGAYVSKMSGWDSLYEPEKFVDPVKGMSGGIPTLGVVYNGVENLSTQLWDYYITDVVNAVYGDASYSIPLGSMSLTLSGQILSESDIGDSIVGSRDAFVYGWKADLGFESTGTTLTMAYNDGNDGSEDCPSYIGCPVGDADPLNGFAGFPLFTSYFHELTAISGAYDNVEAIAGGVEQDLTSLGANGLSMYLYYGLFEADYLELSEFNLLFEYAGIENLTIDGGLVFVTDDQTVTFYDGTPKKDDGFDRYVLRATYEF